MDRLDEFSEWASGLTYDDLPDDVVELARAEFSNNLAAGMVGFCGEAGGYTRRLRSSAGSGPCTMFGGGATDPASACYVNATCSMAHDFDDYLFMGHTGHSGVFASLAAAEANGRGGEELLVALVVANELEGRLGAACAVGPHNGQMWTFIHRAGAAAAAALLLGLETRALRDAVALALAEVPHRTHAGFFQGAAKLQSAAAPTADGYRCALFAASGAPGAARALEGAGGLLEEYPFVPLGEMLDGWGDSWVTRSLCIKPRPGCAYLQSPLENVEELLSESVPAETVECIEVEASLPTLLMDAFAEEAIAQNDSVVSPVAATFSVAYGIAIEFVGDGLDARTLTSEWIEQNRGALEEMANRVTLRHDARHTGELLDGVARAIDVGPLLDARSTFSWISGLVRIASSQSRPGVRSRILESVGLDESRRLLRSLHSPLEWETFEIGDADFSQLAFDFGSTVRCVTSGKTMRTTRRRHRGASRDSVATRCSIAYGKLESAAQAYFDGAAGGASTGSGGLVETVQQLETSLAGIGEVLV